jgi:dTDP-4-dehydrorhamnose reductase
VTGHALVAVTGARGRVGRALVAALRLRGTQVAEWNRPDYQLEDESSPARLVERDRPDVVIHAAAWTDVDGCAREPELAIRRNGQAVGWLAAACAKVGASMVFISTNEVFDGLRTDGQGYAEDDTVRPPNPYGASKLAGEQEARKAYSVGGTAATLWIVRTAWIFGPPGNDFPTKILAAAGRSGAAEPLRVVSDEMGSPTYTMDLAPAVLDLLCAARAGGTFHLAGEGAASRFDVAATVLQRCLPDARLAPISRHEFDRPSAPPAWAVLDCSRAAAFGVRLRAWDAALADYLAGVCS